MQPFPLFLGARRELFGWLHLGRTPASALGVVICPPIGFEYMMTYCSLRRLSERLAAAGISVLRIEYRGLGNSLGGPSDPGLYQGFADDVAAAADSLKRHAGARSIVFVGVRVGGAVASEVARSRSDVAGLVLWEPCSDGRAHIRQLRLLAAASAGADGLASGPGVESNGFWYSPETAEQLSKLSLAQRTDHAQVPTLLLVRDDLPGHAKLAATLLRQQVPLQQETFAGYAQWMSPPRESKLPEQALGRIVAWCVTQAAGAQNSGPGSDARELAALAEREVQHASVPDLTVLERAFSFAHGLFGILVSSTRARSDEPAVVLLNTGADHHVGPHRLYVELARTWAARGCTVLRFDLQGLGGSGSDHVVDNEAYPAHAVRDIRGAVEMLRARGHHTIVLAGLCSGAYHAVYAAAGGVPVSATIAINPAFYYAPDRDMALDPAWNAVDLARLRRSLLTPHKWLRFFRGESTGLRNNVALLWGRARLWLGKLQNGSSEAMRQQDLSALVTPKGVYTQLIFSEEDVGLAFFRESLGERLASIEAAPDFELEIVRGADHAFLGLRMQPMLLEVLDRALERALARLHTERDRSTTRRAGTEDRRTEIETEPATAARRGAHKRAFERLIRPLYDRIAKDRPDLPA